jgi:DNA-binding MarR family transcriptional regulator
MISVEGEGSGEAEIHEESQGLLQEFIDYIRRHKVMMMDDLAAHFGLTTSSAVQRVQSLQAMGRVTGVLDERGKFIYLCPDELQAVADLIHAKGRISIADLATEANAIISLEVVEDEEPDLPDIDEDPEDGGKQTGADEGGAAGEPQADQESQGDGAAVDAEGEFELEWDDASGDFIKVAVVKADAAAK